MKSTAPKIGTPREREILECAAQGLTDKEIAARLGISRETVATYWKRIRLRLDGASRTEAVARALTIEKDREVENLVHQNHALEEEIVARKEAEKQLKVTLRRLKTLVGCVTSGIIFEDSSRQIHMANPALCSTLGFTMSCEDMIGTDCREATVDFAHRFVNPEGFIARVETLVRNRRPVVGDILRMVDGRTIQRDYLPIDSDGEPMGHLWQFRELTTAEGEAVKATNASRFGSVCAQMCAELAVASQESCEALVQRSLEKIGEAAYADRAFVFTFDDDSESVTCAAMWTAPGITRDTAGLVDVPYSSVAWSVREMKSRRQMAISRISAPEYSRYPEIQLWKQRGIISLISVPLLSRGRVVGFVGLDSVRSVRCWPETFPDALEAVGSMIALALSRAAQPVTAS